MRRYYDDLEAVKALASRALAANGRRIGPCSVEWDISGDCTDPYCTTRIGRRGRDNGDQAFFAVDLFTRCRKCERCLRSKRAMWTMRARAEFKRSTRTWFCTFTLDPQMQYLFLEKARAVADEALGRYEDLSPQQQFARRCWAISPEITRYLKRVRKESSAPLRFMLVAEAHASGDPHFHALIHERDPFNPVRKRTLREQWKLGFSRFKLATDERHCRYVTKYISKASLARVRASVRYGETTASAIEVENLVKQMTQPRVIAPAPAALAADALEVA